MNEEVKFLGFKKDIIILDDIIPQEMADKFELTTTKDIFSWYLLRDIQTYKLTEKDNFRVVNDKNTVNTLQFGHGIFNIEDVGNEINSGVYGEARAIADYCCQKFDVIPHYIRLKLNLLANNTLMTNGKYNTPHIDNKFWNSYSMIYYVNDSDGDTIIFNETSDEEKKKRPEKLTINKRIPPKKNRAVLFRGNYFHTSTNPIDNEKRIVLNVNLSNLNEYGYENDIERN
jgi:hypothetical protein